MPLGGWEKDGGSRCLVCVCLFLIIFLAFSFWGGGGGGRLGRIATPRKFWFHSHESLHYGWMVGTCTRQMVVSTDLGV